MPMLSMLRWDSEWGERYCYIAPDGYAYEQPKGDQVARYAHDGGTQTADWTKTILTRQEVGEELWRAIRHAFLSNGEWSNEETGDEE